MTSLLAVDTSSDACSVALIHNSKRSEISVDAPREHTQRLLPMIDELLTQQQLKLSDLDAIAYGRGPGSFTGLRICLGIVQGLAYAADLPVIPISTLQAMAVGARRAYDLPDNSQVIACLDARMSEVYWAHFDSKAEPVGDEYVAPPKDLAGYIASLKGPEPIIAVGPGWHYEDLQTLKLGEEHQDFIPQAQDILTLAIAEWQADRAVAVEQAQPTYLRDSVAWKKREKIRKG